MSKGVGDFTDIFKYVPSLSGSFTELFYNTYFIDYNTLKNIPNGITSLQASFTSTGAQGTINISEMFSSSSKIQNLYQCFRVSNTSNGVQATLRINNDTLRNLKNIQKIGYTTSGDGGTTADNSSFTGPGINKIIEGHEFPYEILNNTGNAGNITMFAGFFKDAILEESSNTVALPGTLFNRCTSLQDVSYCFYGFKSPYTLTSNGFVGTKLTTAESIFGSVDSNDYSGTWIKNQVQGSIPNKLFNLGFNLRTINYTGTTETEKEKSITGDIVSNSSGIIVTSITGNTAIRDTYKGCTLSQDRTKIIYTPISTWTRENLKRDNEESSWSVVSTSFTNQYIDDSWSTSSVSYTAEIPINTISNLKGAFTGFNTEPYTCYNPTVENNPTYCPFEYVKTNGV